MAQAIREIKKRGATNRIINNSVNAAMVRIREMQQERQRAYQAAVDAKKAELEISK